MIVVQLKGGMGNQMFQYAFAKNLSLKYNIPFKMDLSFLKRRDLGEGVVYRNYDLDIFEVDEDFFDGKMEKLDHIQEPYFHYSPDTLEQINKKLKSGILKKPKKILLDGYWQSPIYFKEFEKEVRQDLTFKDKIENSTDPKLIALRDDILECNSVMINIRRADYLNTDFHGVLGTQFIDEGIKIIEKHQNDLKFYVFSDDIEWCKENIKLNNMVIVDHSYKGQKFGHYLQLMRSCKHFIVPNSTFAWWAAWLNENPNKMVVAPRNWFADEKINTNDLIPEDWIRI